MSDAITTPNHTDRPPARDEAAKPIAPLWLFKAINPIMKGLLRSPLHRLLSGTLMLLTYTGRKTGTPYTIPIGYFVWDTDELMAFSSARWLGDRPRDGNPVCRRERRDRGGRLERCPARRNDHADSGQRRRDRRRARACSTRSFLHCSIQKISPTWCCFWPQMNRATSTAPLSQPMPAGAQPSRVSRRSI